MNLILLRAVVLVILAAVMGANLAHRETVFTMPELWSTLWVGLNWAIVIAQAFAVLMLSWAMACDLQRVSRG